MTEPPTAERDVRDAGRIRAGRRRVIGAQLASATLSADDQAVLDASANDVARHLAAEDVGDG